jgi:hypothetical protein
MQRQVKYYPAIQHTMSDDRPPSVRVDIYAYTVLFLVSFILQNAALLLISDSVRVLCLTCSRAIGWKQGYWCLCLMRKAKNICQAEVSWSATVLLAD